MAVSVLALTRYGARGAASRVRHLEFVEPLSRRGVVVTVAPLLSDAYLNSLYTASSVSRSDVSRSYVRRVRDLRRARRFDVVWLEKEALPWVPGQVEAALLGGSIPLVVDVDDLWTDRYESLAHPVARRLLRNKFSPVVRRAAVVTAANPVLAADLLLRGAANVEVVPGSLDLRRYASPDPADPMFTVGWIGTPVTAERYLPAVVGALNELTADGRAKVLLIGAGEAVPSVDAERVSWSYETEIASMSRASVGIMPLTDDAFSRAKSGYKLLQFLALGRPVVASPVGANVEILGAGRRGLAARTQAEWKGALATLRDNAVQAKELGRNGKQYVASQFDLEDRADQVAEILIRAAKGRR